MSVPEIAVDLLVYPFGDAVLKLTAVFSQRGRTLKREDYEYAIRQLQFLLEMEIIDGTVAATPEERFRTWFETGPELSDADRAFEKQERQCDGNYQEFLESSYWIVVRDFVRQERGMRCELCASSKFLNVHHKTYDNHGEEHLHLEDLILLCGHCHAKFHDKLPKEPS